MGFLSQTMLTKSAGWKRVLPTALGTAGFADIMAHGRGQGVTWEDYVAGLKDAGVGRIANTALNLGLGAYAARRFGAASRKLPETVRDKTGFNEGVAALLSVPAKDVLFGLTGPVEHLPEFMDAVPGSSLAQKATAGAALAALPLAYYGGRKFLDNQREIADQAALGRYGSGGTVKVSLPPSREGFPHTVVELPVEAINISKSLTSKLGRDVRRKLRKGTDARTYERDPVTWDLEESEPWVGGGE